MTEAYLNRSVMIYISGWLSKVSCMFKIWQSSSWNFVRKVDALLSLKGMKFVDRAMPFSCISYLCFLSSQWKKKAEELNVELYSFIRRKCDLSILDFRFHITKKNDFSVWLSLFPSVEATWPNLSNSIVMQTSPLKCFPWNNEGYPWWYKTKAMKILIKTIMKFSNVIGYHQPDLSTNRTVMRHACTWTVYRTVKGTVNTSCMCRWTERVMCARCCSAFRRVNSFFFLWRRTTDV